MPDFFNNYEIILNEELSKHTTWRVGGPAKYFYIARDKQNFTNIIRDAIKNDIPYVVLGWGANVLVSDKGFNGLVIKNKTEDINFTDISLGQMNFGNLQVRRSETKGSKNDLSFSDLDYAENHLERYLVNSDSGCGISLLFNKALKENLTGLQWFSGIPASVGGAVFNNIHGGAHFLSEVIYRVEYIDTDGEIKISENRELKFDYDYSIFHDIKSTILSTDFALFKGDIEMASKIAGEWAVRKRSQPRNSAGSTWQNLSEEEQIKNNLPVRSVGYIIDRIANLKGLRFGNAFISIEGNANFIETQNGATAANILDVMKKTRSTVFEKTGVLMKPEIIFIGFENNPLEDL